MKKKRFKTLDGKILESVEFVISEKCQNACKYCYRVKKHNFSPLFVLNELKFEKIVENTLKFVDKNNVFEVEFYGGDPLIDFKKFKEFVKIVINAFPNLKNIVVPTNARSLCEIPLSELEKFIEESKNIIFFSLSVDSPFGDHLRKLSKVGKMLNYDEEINYEKLFQISKKFGFGFHPMLSFENVDNWNKIAKFFIDRGYYPYLLEVRHPLSTDQAKKAVIELAKIKIHAEKMVPKERLKALNTINFMNVPRGLGCSAQTSLTVMPNGDIPFCHRLIDPPWIIGNIFTEEFDEGKYIHFKAVWNIRNSLPCLACPLREICPTQCVGACYEYWGNPWIPIPSVCRYFRLKYLIFSEIFEDWKSPIRKAVDMEFLRKTVHEDFGKKVEEEIINEIRSV